MFGRFSFYNLEPLLGGFLQFNKFEIKYGFYSNGIMSCLEVAVATDYRYQKNTMSSLCGLTYSNLAKWVILNVKLI